MTRNRPTPDSQNNPFPQAQLESHGVVSSLGFAPGFEQFSNHNNTRSFQAMLHEFEVVLSYGRTEDPRVILQAMNSYLLADQQKVGIDLFSRILDVYGAQMSNEGRAVYESGLGILRATYADNIPLMQRIGWVKDSFALIEAALKRTHNNHPIPHWAAGMVYAQVPFFFFKRAEAYKHLTWLADRPDTEPTYGFYREVYRQLALLSQQDKREDAARKWVERAGYTGTALETSLMGWFVTGPDGTSMAPKPILKEVITGRVFALLGFGFSDIYFVLSDDGQELIAVDAGTSPTTMKEAHQFLLHHHPDLPKITTAIVTHSHWDHVGGHGYLREHNPDIAIYGRDNYASVTERVVRSHSYTYFRGEDFDHGWVESYAPTHPISEATMLTIGGSEVSLLPVTGGETEDAMLIHFPKLSTVFVGDLVMPWYGEPWVNEGYASSATDAIDRVIHLNAEHVLHGHHPLTMLYEGENLALYRDMHAWLVETTQWFAKRGYSSKDIIRLNLLPPALVEHPGATLAFVAARDNVIGRVCAELVGIWREDRTGQSPEGMDAITAVERGRLMKDYLGLSEAKAVRSLKRIIAGGDNHLALQFAVAAEEAYGATAEISAQKTVAAERLRGIGQFVDPFGFTAYSEIIKRPHSPFASDGGRN